MRISTAFPSTYLRASDLQGRTIKVNIDKVVIEDIGDDRKPILYFEGKEKGMVMNKTNANTISAAYGDDTDDWQGGELEMFPTKVDFQGKQVDAIRVKIPPRQPARREAAPSREAPPPVDAPRGRADLDDDIPF